MSSSSSSHYSSSDHRQPIAATVKLTLKEVQSAFEPLAARFGPILSLEQAAELAGYTPATLKKKVSSGRPSRCRIRRSISIPLKSAGC